MGINLNISVPAIDKLLDIGVNLVLDPLTARWRAGREVEANKIRALGEAHIREILAVGEAKAALAARRALDVAEAPPVSPSEIYDDMERRLLLLLDRRLENISSIVGRASHALPTGPVPDAEPVMAWTTSYANAAQDISDDDMQELWARVLAGEVEKPGTTSVRTLSVLRELDQATARLFRRLCSMAITRRGHDGLVLDSFVLSPGGNPGMNALERFGASFVDLSVLNEHGLIFGSYEVGDDYTTSIAAQTPHGWEVEQSFFYRGQEWGLFPEGEHDSNQKVHSHGRPALQGWPRNSQRHRTGARSAI